MSKHVYCWDTKMKLSDFKLVDDDYQLKSNETFVRPEDGLYEPITWNGSTWVGTSHEVWEANQPTVKIEPTDQQKLNAQVSLQLAQLSKDVADQKKINAQLTVQLANAVKGDK